MEFLSQKQNQSLKGPVASALYRNWQNETPAAVSSREQAEEGGRERNSRGAELTWAQGIWLEFYSVNNATFRIPSLTTWRSSRCTRFIPSTYLRPSEGRMHFCCCSCGELTGKDKIIAGRQVEVTGWVLPVLFLGRTNKRIYKLTFSECILKKMCDAWNSCSEGKQITYKRDL